MISKEHRVLPANTSPAFLHANSTSHTWIFSAFAELIDNAYDPDAGATVLKMDVEIIKNETCLTFVDNGKGMTPDKLHKMLSFGFCDKKEVAGHQPVGQYGNGFKSGSMRLGRDALVITKCLSSISVGFLSQSYLQKIKADNVLVPMVTMDRNKLLETSQESVDSLDDIYKYSILTKNSDLMEEISKLDNMDTGTRIIIYDLKKGNDNMFELDFISDPIDIINSEHHEFDEYSASRMAKEYVSEYRRSLREYCSILFLKPKMKIILRGTKVKTKLISRSLRQSEVDVYKPKFLQRSVKIIFGFVDSMEDCGMMLYNRNRLIKAYERVGPQKLINSQALGIVGVIEVDFLQPIHNKQDFNKTDRYNACMYSLGVKLNDYWQEKTQATEIDVERIADNWTWVQCDNLKCLKWRRLPEGASQHLPDKWFCYMNRDPTHNRCDIEEEPEDEDALLRKKDFCTYEKTVKKRRNMLSFNKRLTAQQWEEELRIREEQLLKIKQEKDKETEEAQLKVDKLAEALKQAEKKQAEQAKLIMLLSKSTNIDFPSLNSTATSSNNAIAMTTGLSAPLSSPWNESDICEGDTNTGVVVSGCGDQNNGPVRGIKGGCKRVGGKRKNGEICQVDEAEVVVVVSLVDAENEENEVLSVSEHNLQNGNEALIKTKKVVREKNSATKRKRSKKTSDDVIVIDSEEESDNETPSKDLKQELESDDSTDSNPSTTLTNNSEISSLIDPPKRTKNKMSVVIKKKPDSSPAITTRDDDEEATDTREVGVVASVVENGVGVDNDVKASDDDVKDESELSREAVTAQLRNLRTNVAKLLRFMLPELETIKRMKLTEVDAMLVGVLKANDKAEKSR